jgi:Pentapeptide repeats (8 copies)
VDSSNFSRSGAKKNNEIDIWQLVGRTLLSGVILYFIIWGFGRWQTDQAIQDKSNIKERIELEFKIQSHLFELVKTFGNLTFVITAYYAWRNLKVVEENRKLSENQQVSERFSKAVEMLDHKNNDEIKIGGIYLLDRIARDFPQDYWTVLEVLSSFIRRRSPHVEGEEQPKILPDIQLALTTISNLIPLCPEEHKDRYINLENINLRGAFLFKGNLSKVALSKSNLCEAWLMETDLTGAFLNTAILSKAHLFKVILNGADLAGAKLINADLCQASLTGAVLYEADLTGAKGCKVAQIKEAKEWEDAIYDTSLQKRLNIKHDD